MPTLPEKLVLRALFELAQADTAASVMLLAFASDCTTKVVAEALSELHARGLVEVARLRLTFHGLALAVCLPPLKRRGELAA